MHGQYYNKIFTYLTKPELLKKLPWRMGLSQKENLKINVKTIFLYWPHFFFTPTLDKEPNKKRLFHKLFLWNSLFFNINLFIVYETSYFLISFSFPFYNFSCYCIYVIFILWIIIKYFYFVYHSSMFPI